MSSYYFLFNDYKYNLKLNYSIIYKYKCKIYEIIAQGDSEQNNQT